MDGEIPDCLLPILNQICASIPALRPFFAFYLPQLFQITLSNDHSGSPGETNNRIRKLRKSGSPKNSGVVVSSASQEPVVQQHSGGDFRDFHDLHESHHSSQHAQDMHILDEDLDDRNSHPLQEFQGGVRTLQAFHDSPESPQTTHSISEYRDVENPYCPTDSIGIFRPTNIECWYEERDSESGKSTPSKLGRKREGHAQEQRGFDDNFAV